MRTSICYYIFCILLLALVQLSYANDCSKPCQKCPKTPTCKPGVSLVPNECGCCKICARQLYEPCDRTNKCDHHKNLYCSFDDVDDTAGICVATPGRSCHLNGKVYSNGESFMPSCKVICTCIDGDVGCSLQCPPRLSIPKDCDHPRLVKKPTKCCEEWICLKSSRKTPKLEMEREAVRSQLSSQGITYNKYVPGPFGLAAHRREQITVKARENDNCMVQTSPWSACSKTCGWGVSERVTNDNKACKLRKETRLCQIRPCSEDFTKKIKEGKKCIRSPRAVRPVRYSFSGCRTKVYTPKYCGQCVDGRCCTPERTKTVSVAFHCDDGFSFKKRMMVIKSCTCHNKCGQSANDIFNSYREIGRDFSSE